MGLGLDSVFVIQSVASRDGHGSGEIHWYEGGKGMMGGRWWNYARVVKLNHFWIYIAMDR